MSEQHESDGGVENDVPAADQDSPIDETTVSEDSQPATANQDPKLEDLLAERTNDLQRLQAEYVNYKRRVERERQLARESGIDSVLCSLLIVLDDLDRAESHGELEGGFKAVAEQVRQISKQNGVEKFAEVGEPFDPNLHEAVTHNGQSADVQTTSIDSVYVVGYRVGERILRPATVAVVDPE